MVRHPKDIGDWTTLMVISALQDQGLDVYLPFGENTRCDLISDDGRRLSRIQCKTGRLRNGVVVFRPCSSYLRHPNPKIRTRSYIGEIDEFGVFSPENGAVYLIPIDDLSSVTSAYLRIDPVRNGQAKRVRYAARYEVARIDVY
jgi:PD-(D/E)XK endonuclease